MKPKKLKLLTLLLLLLPLCLVVLGTGCERDHESEQLLHNITLSDKPLSVIQKYITGDWKLQYAFGGLLAHKVTDTVNSYMILSPNYIIKGNDSRGVFVDSSIEWIYKYDTYLLDYSYSEGVHFAYIIERIKNDTLMLTEDAGDGFTYFYTKH
ncbi:MAG: hypothetical protein L3J11_04595 [Draconibacterium sp.]|nr:hypothetical protein [Draconibacterium sp.]